MRISRRFVALALTLCLALTMIPGMAMAANALPAANTYGVITLNEDVVLSNPVDILNGTTTTIDLNGKSITASGVTEDYLIAVLHGGKLTIKDSVGTGTINAGDLCAIKMTKSGNNSDAPTAELVIESGTIQSVNSFAIAGNGTVDNGKYRGNTKITINGGSVISTNTHAIYHPQSGELNVNGGTIEGKTGIEMRSGTLKVTGGTIISTGDFVDPSGNVSGTTIKGAAIAVSQHTTNLPINVSITGGTIKATGANGKALYVTDLQNDPVGAEAPVNVEVKGGEFEGAVEVAKKDADEPLASLPNGSKIISGGTFSTKPANELVAPNKGVIKEGNKFVLVGAIIGDGIKIYPAVLDFGTVKVGYTQPAPKPVFIQSNVHVTVTVPDEYEISASEDGTFGENVNIEIADDVIDGIVYIRPKAGLGAGNYTGSVNVSFTNGANGSVPPETNNELVLRFAVETPYAGGSGISVKYTGGNGFSTSNSAVPTGVEIDNVPVSFTGDGRNFTVSCIKPDAKWVTVRWNSTSVTSNFTPDAAAYCAPTNIPKTGDASLAAFVVMAIVAAAGAMRRK